MWQEAFLGVSGSRAIAQTHPTFQKMLRAPSTWVHQTINLAPPSANGSLRLEKCQSWPRDVNVRPPRHLRQVASADYCIQRCDTPDQIRATNTTAGRCVPSTRSSFLNQRYLSHTPQDGRVWHKAFIRWVAQSPGDKPSSFKEG